MSDLVATATELPWWRNLIPRKAADLSASATMVCVLLIEAIFFTVRAPDFWTGGNFSALAQLVAILGIVATGMTFGLISGSLDISVGSTLALSGAVLTRLATAGKPAWESISLCLIVGLLVGLVNGLVVVKLRVNPIVATLGMLGIARGLAYIVSGTTYVATTSDVGSSTFQILQGNILGIPRALVFAAIVMMVGYIVLHLTRAGRYAYAIGQDAQAARSVAISVDRLRIVYLVVSGFCAGLAGWVLASEADGSAGNAALGYELTAVTVVVLGGAGLAGGTGSMIGTALATVVLGVLVDGMNLMGASIFYEFVIPGVFLIAAMGLDSLRTGGYR
jgi:ribose transport system permease protein